MSSALHELTENDISALASAIHYPECWDTAAYPDLMSALREVATWAGCSVCEPGYMRDREVVELRRQLELVTGALERSLNWLSSYPGGCAEGCYAQARAALAAVRGPAASPWQPIETAPKDETFLAVLNCGGEKTICTMRWPVARDKNERASRVGDFIRERVTHWMPLPTPPSSPAGEGEQS